MKLLVIGASEGSVCGVRDHQRGLQKALDELGVMVETVWLERDPREGHRTKTRQTLAWCTRVRATLNHLRPDWLVWQYVPMPYGHRGVPYLVPFLAHQFSRGGGRLVPLLHELTYPTPWFRRAWKGAVQALATRAVLPGLLRASCGVLVTTQQRREWLDRCWWLPHRPVALAPVFSNVPVTGLGFRARVADDRVPAVGVFGFTAEGLLVDVVTASLAILRARGRPTRLVLIGSPGALGPGAERWRESARQHGSCMPEFTGVLEPGPLSAALSDLDILLMPHEDGPISRKGTLAAGLAHGLPIVAFDAPTAWRSLVRERAAALVPATPEKLADQLQDLLRDTAARSELGARAAAFYGTHLDSRVVAGRLIEFLRELRTGAM